VRARLSASASESLRARFGHRKNKLMQRAITPIRPPACRVRSRKGASKTAWSPAGSGASHLRFTDPAGPWPVGKTARRKGPDPADAGTIQAPRSKPMADQAPVAARWPGWRSCRPRLDRAPQHAASTPPPGPSGDAFRFHRGPCHCQAVLVIDGDGPAAHCAPPRRPRADRCGHRVASNVISRLHRCPALVI